MLSSVSCPVVDDPKIATVIVKLASRCNLNCTYCYLYQHADQSYLGRPPLISDRVFDAILLAMIRHCERHAPHRMSMLFHGGEPLLVGPTRLGKFVKRARAALGTSLRSLSIQTNATLIDANWAALLASVGIDVSVSLDGPAEWHDQARRDHHGRGSHENVIQGVQNLIAAGIDPYVLCVIQPSRSGVDAFRYFLDLGIKRFDLLLPDVTHDSKHAFYGRLGPHPVADYLIPIFDLWLKRDDPTVEIRLFNNLLSMLMGGQSRFDNFGNGRPSYLAIDTDGTIEGLDVLRICEHGLSASDLNILTNDFDNLSSGSPLFSKALVSGFQLPSMCRTCPEVEICGGGYPPHRYSRAKHFDNPSVWCADILVLLRHMRRTLRAHGYA
ncbi:radical SAM protein [Bradyrhizobium sp. PUT101]|uniref:radical SAM protein n=1 Tax=Bradyrhizobium sp. PUT101 TaxID=3447427 RepID=UPI003F82CC13